MGRIYDNRTTIRLARREDQVRGLGDALGRMVEQVAVSPVIETKYGIVNLAKLTPTSGSRNHFVAELLQATVAVVL